MVNLEQRATVLLATNNEIILDSTIRCLPKQFILEDYRSRDETIFSLFSKTSQNLKWPRFYLIDFNLNYGLWDWCGRTEEFERTAAEDLIDFLLKRGINEEKIFGYYGHNSNKKHIVSKLSKKGIESLTYSLKCDNTLEKLSYI